MSTQKTFREYSVCPWDVLFFTRDPSIIPDHGDRGGRPLAHSGMAQERPTRDLSAVDRSPPQSAAGHTTAAGDRTSDVGRLRGCEPALVVGASLVLASTFARPGQHRPENRNLDVCLTVVVVSDGRPAFVATSHEYGDGAPSSSCPATGAYAGPPQSGAAAPTSRDDD